MTNTLAKIFACFLCFLLTKAGAQNLSDLLQQGMSVQHAVVPLYPTGSFKLSAVVRVDRAFMDYQHKGFFRIGFLPIGVLDGVTIETRDTADPFASLACLRRWLGSKAGQRVEMRRVKFLISPTKSLEAGLARCGAGDRWDLLNGVRFVSGDGEVQASRATLEMAGPRAGQVIFETTPRTTNIFFASALTFNDASRPPLTK
ncbi:MAG: hypothetical protein ACLQU4_14670 [Limisphaerales bacterium]